MISPVTPSQTIGPFLAIGLPWPDGPFVVPEGTPGAITITGTVLDGAGDPLTDALVETWQADPEGRFRHPDDPRGGVAGRRARFRGFGRCATGEAGEYRIVTLRPGPLPCPDGRTEAPHLDVSIFARGLLDRLVTRIYFPDEAQANATDPVLAAIGDPSRRATLIAIAEPGGRAQGDSAPGGSPPGDSETADALPRRQAEGRVADRTADEGRVADRTAGSGKAGGGRATVFRFDILLQGESETVFFDV